MYTKYVMKKYFYFGFFIFFIFKNVSANSPEPFFAYPLEINTGAVQCFSIDFDASVKNFIPIWDYKDSYGKELGRPWTIIEPGKCYTDGIYLQLNSSDQSKINQIKELAQNVLPESNLANIKTMTPWEVVYECTDLGKKILGDSCEAYFSLENDSQTFNVLNQTKVLGSVIGKYPVINNMSFNPELGTSYEYDDNLGEHKNVNYYIRTNPYTSSDFIRDMEKCDLRKKIENNFIISDISGFNDYKQIWTLDNGTKFEVPKDKEPYVWSEEDEYNNLNNFEVAGCLQSALKFRAGFNFAFAGDSNYGNKSTEISNYQNASFDDYVQYETEWYRYLKSVYKKDDNLKSEADNSRADSVIDGQDIIDQKNNDIEKKFNIQEKIYFLLPIFGLIILISSIIFLKTRDKNASLS